MPHRHDHGERDLSAQELLEALWTEREDGRARVEGILARADIEGGADALARLVARGLVSRTGDEAFLTGEGEREAAAVVRRHRLAELLLTQVLDLRGESMEREACEFEHSLTPEVTDSICTLLGHPDVCPHGKPIPRARCCEKSRTEVAPLLVRVPDLGVGQRGRIALIAPTSHARLDRLGAYGIVPGAEVRLHQKFPSFVLQLGETTVALDAGIAGAIFVRPSGDGC
jgi:DtxR family transcriptional regulator, Mn-dependent transcriptional regulator